MNWVKLLKDVGLPLAKVAGKFILKKIVIPWAHETYEDTIRKQILIYTEKLQGVEDERKRSALKAKIDALETKLKRRHS